MTPARGPAGGGPRAPEDPKSPKSKGGRREDRGYATAEAAVALPTLLVVLSLAVAVVVSVGAQLRCVDAARAGARVVARGDSEALATRAAEALAPGGARVRIARRGREVEVRVEADVRVTRWLPAVHVGARAVAEAEGR